MAYRSSPRSIDAAVRCVAELAGELEIPPLGEFGLGEADVPDLVARARKASSMRYNPVMLSDEVLCEVLRKAL